MCERYRTSNSFPQLKERQLEFSSNFIRQLRTRELFQMRLTKM